jgi:hypothetical protein
MKNAIFYHLKIWLYTNLADISDSVFFFFSAPLYPIDFVPFSSNLIPRSLANFVVKLHENQY